MILDLVVMATLVDLQQASLDVIEKVIMSV
jgi:hypothetical protein